jgi:hypothetical protein
MDPSGKLMSHDLTGLDNAVCRKLAFTDHLHQKLL